MKYFLLYLFTSTALWAQVATKIQIAGYTMPDSLIGTPWLTVTNFSAPKNEAHLGVGIGYRSSEFKVDIYIYEALEKPWVGLSIKDRVQKEIEAIPSVFETMIQKNLYSNVHIVSRDVQNFSGREYSHFEIRFSDQKAGDLISHYYLSSLDDNVLKIRISRSPDSDPKIVPEIMQEISQALKSNGGNT